MKIGILSYGAVSPGGMGPDAIENPWPTTDVMSGSGRHQNKAALVDRTQPELARWGKEARLRRASPITYFMIEAASQALAARPEIDLSRTGVIASFFLGCLIYSVRFYQEMGKDGRRFASPVLFPETVFNSPVSHLVTTLGLGGPVYSQVGDKSCWANALRTAECWLRRGSAENVLILGAEEFDPYQLDAFHAAGWLRGNGLIPSDGAGAILVSSHSEGHLAELASIADGFSFSSRSGALSSARDCLSKFPENIPILPTGTSWTCGIESIVAEQRLLPDDRKIHCEGSTASAAWDTIRGIRKIQNTSLEELIVPFWGLSQQCAAARLLRTAVHP